MTDEKPLEFPSYSPPAPPQGIPVADPKFHKPLVKLMRQMLRPRHRTLKTKTHNWKKKHPYY